MLSMPVFVLFMKFETTRMKGKPRWSCIIFLRGTNKRQKLYCAEKLLPTYSEERRLPRLPVIAQVMNDGVGGKRIRVKQFIT